MTIRGRLRILAALVLGFLFATSAYVLVHYRQSLHALRKADEAILDFRAVIRLRGAFLREDVENLTQLLTGDGAVLEEARDLAAATRASLERWIETERETRLDDEDADSEKEPIDRVPPAYGAYTERLNAWRAVIACGATPEEESARFLKEELLPLRLSFLSLLDQIVRHEEGDMEEALDQALVTLGVFPGAAEKALKRIRRTRLAVAYHKAVDTARVTLLRQTWQILGTLLGPEASERPLAAKRIALAPNLLEAARRTAREQKTLGLEGEPDDIRALERIEELLSELDGEFAELAAPDLQRNPTLLRKRISQKTEPLLDRNLLPRLELVLDDAFREVEAEYAATARYARRAAAQTSGLLFGIAALFATGALIPMRRIFVALGLLHLGVRRLGEGDLDTEIKLPGRDEMSDLAAAFNESTRRLKAAVVSRRLLDDILASMNDILFVTDRDGRIRMANRAACRLLGLEQAGIEGRPLRAFIADDTDPLCPETPETGTTGEPSEAPFRGEVLFRGADGTLVPVYFSCSPLPGTGGRPGGHVCAGQDISAVKAMQQQVAQAQKMESVGAMAGGLAHDLGNILTVVIGNSQLALLHLPEGHPARRHIRAINEAGESASGLVQRLLAFARKQKMEVGPVALNPLIEQTLSLLDRVVGRRITLRFERRAARSHVLADRGQVEQILINLVLNARDAMPSGGTIEIFTEEKLFDEDWVAGHKGAVPGPYVMFAVADEGVGIPPEIQQKIFEPFFTTKGEERGTGLGLASVYGIVKQLKGYLLLESRPGRGSTFRIYLPATETAERDEPAEAARPSRILVVDDEELCRGLVRHTLEAYGYAVVPAASAEDALGIVRSGKPPFDLLITDVVMPGIPGPHLAERLRELFPGLPVILMSGHVHDSARQGSEDTGHVLLPKPVTIGELASRIRALLDGERER